MADFAAYMYRSNVQIDGVLCIVWLMKIYFQMVFIRSRSIKNNGNWTIGLTDPNHSGHFQKRREASVFPKQCTNANQSIIFPSVYFRNLLVTQRGADELFVDVFSFLLRLTFQLKYPTRAVHCSQTHEVSDPTVPYLHRLQWFSTHSLFCLRNLVWLSHLNTGTLLGTQHSALTGLAEIVNQLQLSINA